jgi:hypothetical protein
MPDEPIQLDPSKVAQEVASLAGQQHQSMLLELAKLTVYVRELEQRLKDKPPT